MPNKNTTLCRRCGAHNKLVKHNAGSVWLEVLLWLILITPGFIYHMWRHKHNYHQCHDCGYKTRLLRKTK